MTLLFLKTLVILYISQSLMYLDISRRPVKPSIPSPYKDEIVPKSYDALAHKPSYHHGYDSNKVGQENPTAPYAKATVYGQRNGGYKIADAYQNQDVVLKADNDQDYKEDYVRIIKRLNPGYR